MPDFEDLYPAGYVDDDPKPCQPVACPPWEEVHLDVSPVPPTPGEFAIAAYHGMTGTTPPPDVNHYHVMLIPQPSDTLDTPVYPRTPAEAAEFAHLYGARFVYAGAAEFKVATMRILIDSYGWPQL